MLDTAVFTPVDHFEQSVLKENLFSTAGIVAVIFLNSDCEHGFKTLHGARVRVIWVGTVDKIIAGVLILVAALVPMQIWMLAAVVHH